ncbi:MAG: OmpA family protein [Bacteroidaceae bacterium]|nr:OmpA family protein [Bacteroidaceae bacterium]
MKRYILFIASLIVLLIVTSCGSAKLSVANEQYERGEYYVAAQTYRKVYNKMRKKSERPMRGHIAYMMGDCYRRINMSARASAAFNNAVRYKYAETDSMTFLYLAQSQHAEGKYKDAIKNYELFLEKNPHSRVAHNGLIGCVEAVKWKDNPTRYVVKRADLFNSRRSDCSPMLQGEEFDQLYITTSTDKAVGEKKSAITGTKNFDIFLSKKNEKGEWMKPEPIEGEINTEADEGMVSFSPDGSTMYLSKARQDANKNAGAEIYTSTRSGAQWSAPTKLEIIADTISSLAHPAVSPDGLYLYFTSDMPGGYGGKDIWRVGLGSNTEGTLENLGEKINTPADEMFPYVRTDSMLYFSSDGHPGMGGLDIFVATLDSLGNWHVENMKHPMNSTGDDFGITFGVEESGYFSSNRKDGRGFDKIYSFEKPSVRVSISGMVLDKDDEPIPDAIIRIVGDDGSNQKEVARKDGSFKFSLNRGVRYVMMAGCRGYLNGKQEFESDTTEADAEYVVDFILASVTKPVILENIFYDFDKATLRPESEAALDSELITILNDNPNITIELASHTDFRGRDAYNQELSQRRAQSVVDYLIANGIAPERVKAVGYGETVPKTITKKLASLYPQFKEGDVLSEEFILTLSEEDQETAHQINRRTEFQVLSITYNLY